MTQQIDFYILGTSDRMAKLKYACRIAQKAYSQELKVYLQTATHDQSEELDTLLWTFSQGDFVPHTISNDASENWVNYPVQLGSPENSSIDKISEADLLISLIDEIPDAHGKFRRIVDLITDDPTDKANGRNRFRYYREQGIEPNTHTVA